MLVVRALVLAALLPGARAAELPAGLAGFSGALEGAVVEKAEHGFILYVGKVSQVWKGNRAAEPASAVGRRLRIDAQWHEAEPGVWKPVPQHDSFVRSLRVGEVVEIEVKNDEGQRLHILELSQAQRERAAQGEVRSRELGERERAGREERERAEQQARERAERQERERAEQRERAARQERERAEQGERTGFPDGLRGFRGMLHGRVVEVGERGFVLEVDRVARIWEASEAREPESAVGRRLLVNVRSEKNDAGEWRPAPQQLELLRTLERGEEVEVDVGNLEAERLHILELTRAQRERIQTR